ncbi:MAG: phytoene desaturase family protein [Cellulosilyticaceae bacterium]
MNITIVGSGIGGLCTGIRLLYTGCPVTIYEKNPHAGGVLTSIHSPNGNFTFDESASIAINPLTYFEIFRETNRRPEDYFEWSFLDDFYKVFWSSGKTLTLNSHLSETQRHLTGLFPLDVDGYASFVLETSLKYLQAKKHLLGKAFLQSQDFWNPKTLLTLLKINPLPPSGHYIKKFIQSPELIDCILFQTLFMGISPYKLSNIYTAIPAQSQLEGIMHIQGGLPRYTQALTQLFLELGGILHCNHPITKVITSSHHVEGILCNGHYIPTEHLILNTDLPYTFQKLLPNKSTTSFGLSCSTFIIHLGLDTHFKQLKTHNLYINKNFKREVERIFKGKLPIAPSLYVYYPSPIDDSYCKNPNHSVMNIMVRVPNLHDACFTWTPAIKKALYHLCLKTLHNLSGLENIADHIVYRTLTTPHSFSSQYNYTSGACFGIGHTYAQSIAFRPQIQDPIYNNLYYVGSSIHPGNGASIVMDCAKLLAETLIGQNS